VHAGCGGDRERAATTIGTTTTTETAPSTKTQTQTSSEADPLAGASTQPATVKATNTNIALLDDVRAARHAGYDRVVFQFGGEMPGYDVRYVKRPVVEDGSGKTVDVKGAAVLLVRMENALDADLTKSDAPRTYTGPVRFSPATSEVAELVRTGGFEGVLTWAIGLNGEPGFRVMALQGPPRLVIDVRNR
jgi:hypothetical protein